MKKSILLIITLTAFLSASNEGSITGNVYTSDGEPLWGANVYLMGTMLGASTDSSGAFSIVCLLDNDEAGVKGAKKIYEQCSKMYRLYFPKFNANDINNSIFYFYE